MHNHQKPEECIGLARGVVRLAPHDPRWKDLFEAEKQRLLTAVGQHVLEIQHVGSTAIPGLPAKPIIDIGIAVEDFEAARVCIEPITALGYEYKGENGIPHRHYFALGEPRRFHLHMFELKSIDWENHILFRDHLAAHPELVTEYAALKQSLAQQYPNDRNAYQEGKASFIERVLRKARK
jgi:GrpB-like predicted nucleotidyltransferase (UPF0157 family)